MLIWWETRLIQEEEKYYDNFVLMKELLFVWSKLLEYLLNMNEGTLKQFWMTHELTDWRTYHVREVRIFDAFIPFSCP